MSTKCEGCSRRTFLVGVALVPLIASCQTSAATGNATACTGGLCLDLADSSNAPLKTVGGSVLIDSQSDTIIVIRDSDTTAIALSAVCTHSGCIVDYDNGSKILNCACHGSQFGLAGNVLKTPARRSLRVYTATLSATEITVAT